MQKAKGVRDIFGIELNKMERIRSVFLSICKSYNANYIELPLLEPKELFERSVGDSSDIVQKEMFEIKSDNEALVLRPEGTASIVRAMRENLNEIKLPAKLSYYGAMFRKERPQKGRYRQFYQCGIEYIGEAGFGPEIESLLIIKKTLEALGVNQYEIQINYLGNIEERSQYKESLVSYFKENLNSLSEDSQRRLSLNPLRILDSKDEKDIKICQNAPSNEAFLTELTKKSLDSFYNLLTSLDIKVTKNSKLVRGLDYYTGIVFEIIDTSNKLGSQSAIGGGGRYDGLVNDNKISTEGGFGFALGVDRLMLILDDGQKTSSIDLALITTTAEGLIILNNLRDSLVNEYKIDVNYNIESSFKKKFKRADALNAKNVLILGGDEIAGSFFKIKNLTTGIETKFDNVKLNSFSETVKEYLNNQIKEGIND